MLLWGQSGRVALVPLAEQGMSNNGTGSNLLPAPHEWIST
jgi:hypothetical protein